MTGVASSQSVLRKRPLVLVTFFDGSPTKGGSYTHRRGALKALHALQCSELRVIVVCDGPDSLGEVRAEGLTGVIRRRNLGERALGKIASAPAVKAFFGASLGPRLSPVSRLLEALGADLVLFTSPDARAAQLYKHNFVFTVMDLCHLEHPEFPEVAHDGEFEKRELLFQSVLRKATAVLADSETGRRLIARHYAVPKARIHVAPFLMNLEVRGFRPDPDVAARVRARYGVRQPYIFYPAQLWPHKNHRYILEALAVMRRHKGNVPQAVFCGSEMGNLQELMSYAAQLRVDDLVRYCGFVPAGELPYLYSDALALVMPTYFGPTNIPPMEALALGVPVLYSDLPSFREQLGEAARYIDLERPESLADALDDLLTGAGGRPAGSSVGSDDIAAYAHVLAQILSAYRRKVGPPRNGDDA